MPATPKPPADAPAVRYADNVRADFMDRSKAKSGAEDTLPGGAHARGVGSDRGKTADYEKTEWHTADGKKHALKDYAGRKVVLYFYPKDNTPGCTTEACDFRDNMKRLARQDVVVLGVSPDSAASHVKFRDKFDLNFTLLSDPDKKMMAKYGAFGEKTMYGKKTMGVIRSTFLIDEKGKVLHVWPNVKAKGHVDKVLEKLAELG